MNIVVVSHRPFAEPGLAAQKEQLLDLPFVSPGEKDLTPNQGDTLLVIKCQLSLR